MPASELGLREPFVAMGALPAKRGLIPSDPIERITNAFFGRMAVRVDFLCEMGDLIPGQSGEALSRDFFGFVPPHFHSKPSARRLPFIISRYPQTVAKIGRRIVRLRISTDSWWRRETSRVADLDLTGAQQMAIGARDRFFTTLAAQAVISATVIQPVQEQFSNLCTVADVDPAVLLRGSPHEESSVLDDLWAASRGSLDVEEFMRRHGYHGPGEGELETRVWREDVAAVHDLVRRYRAKSDTESPRANAVEHQHRRQQAERQLMSALGPTSRLRAHIILRLARHYIPLRGTGKVAYLQSLDVLRAAARRIGSLLFPAGRLAAAEDVFYLTIDELTGAAATDPTVDLSGIVQDRREIRSQYQTLVVPKVWTGQPEPESVGEPTAMRDTLSGIGACAGVVEGRAVVVTDPLDTDVIDGDVLVAHTTDPSWVSLMFLSSALVVDIGGMMSHAAVVARELGIPCVMNTGTGTTTLRTGDRIRVDGTAGTIEIIGRDLQPSPTNERTSL
ncbi:PEP-utilizing enzyme [Mycobacteroides franklinii]|uniref:PEP-utilizing enzyme n=1 Tax=Mycobacteroides franklinii TaxID=948102 RepID=UPI0013E8F499|nr:phosphoenolpyruvate-utilizing protein [Mycobacteroides franklinii]